MRVSLRKEETEQKYQECKKMRPEDYCPFCDLEKLSHSKKEYKYWRILPNDFPYDAVYTISDLLVSKRHVKDEMELKVVEAEELKEIKRDILNNNLYDQIQENAKPRRTIPPHYHLHLLTY